MNNNNNNRIRLTGLRAIFAGETQVGKTSLIGNYCGEMFQEDVLSTIGCEHYEKRIEMKTMNIK